MLESAAWCSLLEAVRSAVRCLFELPEACHAQALRQFALTWRQLIFCILETAVYLLDCENKVMVECQLNLGMQWRGSPLLDIFASNLCVQIHM